MLTASLTHPSLDVVVRIARAVNENVGWLLDEPGFSLSAAEHRVASGNYPARVAASIAAQ